jgi:Protein of unknown function (DUF2589)
MSLQIAELTISFNSKLTSMVSSTDEKIEKSDNSYSRSNWNWWTVDRVSGTISSQTKNTKTNDESREFSLNIKVRAVQDDTPGGLLKVLSIMEDAILRSD